MSDYTENTASNSSSIVACFFYNSPSTVAPASAAEETCLQRHCLATTMSSGRVSHVHVRQHLNQAPDEKSIGQDGPAPWPSHLMYLDVTDFLEGRRYLKYSVHSTASMRWQGAESTCKTTRGKAGII